MVSHHEDFVARDSAKGSAVTDPVLRAGEKLTVHRDQRRPGNTVWSPTAQRLTHRLAIGLLLSFLSRGQWPKLGNTSRRRGLELRC
jgi:hypothetical protein